MKNNDGYTNNMYLLRKHKLFLLTIIVAVSCSSQLLHRNPPVIKNAFYYWKNQGYTLSTGELRQLWNNDAQRLYVKFFEVEKHPVFGAIPAAKTNVQISDRYYYGDDDSLDKVLKSLEIVPVIYINNNVLLDIPEDSIYTLASDILFLTDKYYKERIHLPRTTWQEIQLDCDWTKITKGNYFKLLSHLKKISGKKLSCTLRLYPYKYNATMGIPPVDRVMLMCYNLNNPLQHEDKNSILEADELGEYIKGVKKYPLPMDVALPEFSWVILYQNGEFRGLIDATEDDLKNVLLNVKPMWYKVTADTVINNIFIRAGDDIKIEKADSEIYKSVTLLKNNLNFADTAHIAIFSLNNKNKTQNDSARIHNLFAAFSN